MESLDDIARTLVDLRALGGTIRHDLLTACDSLNTGFELQALVTERMGGLLAGWKVALPPDGEVLSAPIFAADVFASNSTVSFPGRMANGIECELAFRMDRHLPVRTARGYQASDVAPCIGGVMAAFELLQSRLADGFQSPRPHLLADCLGNGGVVLGELRSDWRWQDHAAARIDVLVDGETVSSRLGGNPVGDPFRAVVALAEHLALRGLALQPGQFVMTGAFTGVHHLQPGQSIKAVFEGLTPVQLLASASGWSSHQRKENLHAGG